MNPPQVAQSPEKEISSLGPSTAAVAEALEMILGWATDDCLSACEPPGCEPVALLQEDRNGECQALLHCRIRALDIVLFDDHRSPPFPLRAAGRDGRSARCDPQPPRRRAEAAYASSLAAPGARSSS